MLASNTIESAACIGNGDLNDIINTVGQATPRTSTRYDRGNLDLAILDGARNGWTSPDEKARAQRCLADHIRTGRLTPEQAAAYALTSPAVSERGAKRLR